MAQCGHAVLGAYKRCQKFAPSALKWWENLGQAKICVNCPTGVEMEEIEQVSCVLPPPICFADLDVLRVRLRTSGFWRPCSCPRLMSSFYPAPLFPPFALPRPCFR